MNHDTLQQIDRKSIGIGDIVLYLNEKGHFFVVKVQEVEDGNIKGLKSCQEWGRFIMKAYPYLATILPRNRKGLYHCPEGIKNHSTFRPELPGLHIQIGRGETQ